MIIIQYDNNFYLILDRNLQRVGILSNTHHGATPFYNDLIVQQIADNDQQINISSVQDDLNAFDTNGNTKSWGHTLVHIYIPYGYDDTKLIREGNHLAYQDPNNYHWYVMRITHVTDSINKSGVHYKEASGVNLLIWKLGKTVHYPKVISHANSKEAFEALLAGSGWFLDPQCELVGGSHDIEFDGISSSQALLQQLCQKYGAELDAYVQFNKWDWNITLKRVDIKRHLGRDNGQRIMYGHNATNISRSEIDDSLYTKLFVYGKDGTTCACNESNNQPFVKDDVANQIYSQNLKDNAVTYLEGVITSSTIDNPLALYEWGKKQLKLFNHPRANYTVGISQNAVTTDDNISFTANLGDTFRVIDLVMDPELTVESRVIKKQLSFADPSQNQLTLGEFTTVNVVPPSFIRNLRQGIDNHLTELIEDLRHNPNALSCVIDKPDGTSWGKDDQIKKFTAHVSIMGEDISPYIKPEGYIWSFYPNDSNNSGVIDRAGNADTDFYQRHRNDGQTLIIKNDEASAGEVRLTIDTSFIDDDPEINFDTNAITQQFTVNHWQDNWGDDRIGALQFINHDQTNNEYYASQVYYGSQRPRNSNGHLIGSDNGKHACRIHSEISRLDTNGNYQDSMILLFSHHNGSFGLQRISNQNYIWTTIEDYYHNQATHDRRYWVVRIPYLPNEVITPSDSRYEKIYSYSEPSVMVYYDSSSNKVLFSHDNTAANPQHQIEIYDANELIKNKNNVKPQRSFSLIDYGFQPKNADGSDDQTSKQTFQSGCLKYPYYIFTSGNVNMSDQRMIYGINVQTETLVFKLDLVLEDFNLGNYVFAEPETINWTLDEDNNLVFLFGMNTATYDKKITGHVSQDPNGQYRPEYEHVERLWKVGFNERDSGQYSGGNIPTNGDE